MCALLAATFWKINDSINANAPLVTYLNAHKGSSSVWYYNPNEGAAYSAWSLKGGMDFFYLGLIQAVLSYPLMDAALTDRAFLADKETMLAGFFLGSIIAIVYIIVFGFLGIYGNMVYSCIHAGACPASDANGASLAGLEKGSVSAVGVALGGDFTYLLCTVIIISALSTLDSTFSSVAKAFGPDLHGFLTKGRPVDPSEATATDRLVGRIGVVVIGVCGTLPLLYNPSVLSATTVSGTMVPGMGPPIYCAALACLFRASWSGRRTTSKTRPLLYILPFFYGAALGTAYQMIAPNRPAFNCVPSKLLDCPVPTFTSAPQWTQDLICSQYNDYYRCIRKSGCWVQKNYEVCQGTNADQGCSNKCWKFKAQNRPYTTIVDMAGFKIGDGTYAMLLGVNIVSAIGALALYLFLLGDDVLEMHFAEAAAASKDTDAESTI
jgi:hypothetical protein